jgi:hypothetical protein
MAPLLSKNSDGDDMQIRLGAQLFYAQLFYVVLELHVVR